LAFLGQLNVIYSTMAPRFSLQTIACPLCGSIHYYKVYTIKGFAIVRCKDCRLVYVNPRISDEQLFEIYRHEYFRRKKGGYDDYEKTEFLRRKTFGKWYRQLLPFVPPSRKTALDIGCAAGFFMDILLADDWDAEGIELDNRVYQHLKEKKYAVSNTPLEFFETQKKYSLITLFDVLEHVPSLNDDVAKISSLLHDDGIVVLVTPNIESRQSRLCGRWWFQLKPDEHIYYFSPQTLQSLAHRHGLEVLFSAPAGQFADRAFLQSRFKKYGFALPGFMLLSVLRLFGFGKKLWYTDTGSVFVVMRKRSG